MQYIRFVVWQKDGDSGVRQGLFAALGELDDSNALLAHEKQEWDHVYRWFKRTLPVPNRFARSSRTNAKRLAISWFKATANEHIRQMRALSAILGEHGIRVEMIQTDRPGYIVYEDRFQVAAEPFSETAT